MTEKTMIQFENVSKVYGEKTVVQPLDVSIQKGEFITILGTSGWLRCLADWPFSSHDCCGQHCDCA